MSESVIGIVFDPSKSNVLIVQRRDTGVWALPGGGIDPNESPELAVTREIEEETGYRTCITAKIAEYTPINRLTKVTHVYSCHIINGEAAINSESLGVGFFPIDNLPNPFFYIHEGWIHEALNFKGQLIQRPINEVTYFSLLKYLIKHPITFFRFLLCRLGFPINTK